MDERNDILSPQEYQAIEKFVKDLKECYTNKSNNSDPLSKAVMWYVLQTLDIHLSLAEIKLKRFMNEMAVTYGEK